MECESMLFIKNHIPYLWDISNSFSNSFIDFYSCEVVSWIDFRKNKVLSFKGAQSRYSELFWASTKLPLNWRKPENNTLQRIEKHQRDDNKP